MSTQSRPAPSLPPLRILMGGAVGLAVGTSGAEAQTQAQAGPPPTPAATDAALQLPTVEVGGQVQQRGYQTSLPSLSKFTGTLSETPQSISVVPRQLIEDQNIVNTRDALRNVPGISLGAGEGGAQGDNLTLRGFSARNDLYLDGMRDFGSYTRDPFDLESIEVLKGPASVAFGRGSTGGVVQQVTKQPGLAPITAGSLTFGTDGTKRITGDVNRAIDQLPGAAVRLNFMVNESGIADRNADKYRRFGIAPSVAFGIGTPTRFALNYLHQQEYDTPDYGLPWLYNSPAQVPRQNFYGFKDSDYYRTNVDIVTAKFEHDFNKNVTVRDQFRYGNYYRDIRVTEPQVVYSGTLAARTLSPTVRTPLGNIQVNRNTIAAKSTETFLQNQTDLTVRFATGPVQHSLVAGIELGQETSSPARFSYTGNPRTNLLNPNMNDLQLGTGLGRATVTTDAATRLNTAAFYAIDTIKFLEKFDLTIGVRYDYLDTKYDQNVAPIVRLGRTDSIPSTRFALSYHPVPEGTLYVSYGTSFNPSAEALALATSTVGLAPEENETYEIGAKWEVLDRKLTLSTALFQLEKTNARVTDPNNSLFQILGGDQRVRGVEFGVIGNITDRWQISAGYAYLNSETVKTTLALTQGQVLANTPKHSGSVFTTYRLPWRDIQIGAGVNGVSDRLASSSPDTTTGAYKKAPGYITVQAMLKVPLREGLDLQLNGYNLTNQRYYDLLHPSHVVPGAGRSLLASLNFKL